MRASNARPYSFVGSADHNRTIASLVQREVGRRSRAGGIVCYGLLRKNDPSVSYR